MLFDNWNTQTELNCWLLILPVFDRLAIQELIEDGAVYNTIDYFHFKIA